MKHVAAWMVVSLSGLLLWDGFNVGWEIRKWLLAVHPPLTLVFFGLYLFSYLLKHLLYHVPELKKTKSFRHVTGTVLAAALVIGSLSGVWLMVVGQRGDGAGIVAHLAHLGSSFLFVAALLLHAGRFRSGSPIASIGLLALFFSLTGPADASALASEDMSAAYARGEKLFYSTKESGVPGLLMGDGSKSCATCHKGGFNESNRLLFDAAAVDPKRSAVIGHKHLKNFFAKDFADDYFSAILEQGGVVEHRDEPSVQMLQAMGDLHRFIRSRTNLPFFSTWVRLDENITHYHPKEWINSASCQKCHPEIFSQWADSNHRLMGGSNPYYSVLEDLAAKEEGEGIRFWCMGCHSPGVLSSGGRQTSKRSHLFDKNARALVEGMKKGEYEPEEGTSCLFCHRISKLEEVRGNGGYTLNLRDRPTYPFEGRSGALGAIHEAAINAKPRAHAESYRREIYRDSRYCMSCHTEFSPGAGALIVDTYGEWKRSAYNRGKGNPKTRGCIDCHMNPTPSGVTKKVPGRSTLGGTLKEGVKTHHFAGSNHFLSGLRNPEHEKMTLDMLKSAAKLQIRREKGELIVRVSNVGAGHHLPTGVADFRELWLEVKVSDRSGKLLLSSGKIGADGEIEAGSRLFRKVYGDREGRPVGLKFWKYEKLLEDTRIPANGFRDERFALPQSVSYPLEVEVRLRFRIYPQWVTRIVQQHYPQLPTPPAVTLHTRFQTWSRP